jgi:hypothetical protein
MQKTEHCGASRCPMPSPAFKRRKNSPLGPAPPAGADDIPSTIGNIPVPPATPRTPYVAYESRTSASPMRLQESSGTYSTTSGFIPKERLNQMPYPEDLKTAYWQTVRSSALKRADYKCQLCGNGERPLEVHHTDYSRRGYELSSDIIALCSECHGSFHAGGNMPV